MAHGTPLSGRDVLLWGIQRSCEPLAAENRSLEKALSAPGTSVRLLTTPSGQPVPPCAPEVVGSVCAPALVAACPGARGYVLGGQVEATRSVVRSRLWLHDLSSGQTAYHDDYCQSCDLQLASALAAQARALLAAPVFVRAAPSAPSYCRSGSGTAARATSPTQPGPLWIAVYGAVRQPMRQALLDALQKQLGLRQRTVQILDKHSDLKAHILSQPGAQGIGLEIPERGKPTLFLVDQKTGRTLFAGIDCSDCQARAEDLTARVATQVAGLLDQCIGWSCADENARPQTSDGTLPPPPEACEPLPFPTAHDAA